MRNQIKKIKAQVLELFLKTPFLARYSNKWYRLLGLKISEMCFIAPDVKIIGDYSNVKLAKNVSIYHGGVLTTKNKITIGENTGIAHQVLILTSSNPRGPLNKLSRIYDKVSKPVNIGDNCWIGARSTILPGITIGNCCVVAAGSLVNNDISDYTVVAGVPAKVIKHLNPDDFK